MTNQFTDEQVTAARQARNSHDFVGHGKCRCGAGGFTSIGHGQHQVRAALEAAAGVAPQEPSERTPEFESREQELFKHQPVLSMKDGGIAGCKCMDRVFVTKTEDWGTHLAEVFTRLSRTTVPDAATAAVDRVRALAHQHRSAEQHNETVPLSDIGDLIGEPSSADYLAALDEAPEPEWEYGSAHRDDPSVGATEYSTERAEQRVREWNDHDDQKGGLLVRRRPAGPWESVEGQVKP